MRTLGCVYEMHSRERLCFHFPTWFASELELLREADMTVEERGCWRAENDEADGWISGGV